MQWLTALVRGVVEGVLRFLERLARRDVPAVDAETPAGERDRILRVLRKRLRQQDHPGASQ